MTTGQSTLESAARASGAVSNTPYICAVGMPWRRRNSFAKILLPSSCAACCEGATIGQLRCWYASPIPFTKGSSGPTMVRSGFRRSARAARPAPKLKIRVLALGSGRGQALLIPLRHENMEGRRWPVISIALIVINLVAFLGTHWQIDAQNPKRSEVRAHILLLAGMHPELSMNPDVQEFVTTFREKNPSVWSRVTSPNREVADPWDAKMRLIEDPAVLQGEMDSLARQYTELEHDSILSHYAFIPAHVQPISYITANFLHGGWMHIIGNMWFLWLAGAILEDTWGRIIYPIFYFLSGAMALQFYAWANAGSIVPTLGASGAVAALMGAFLVRFPKTKIEMLWLFGFGVRSYRFHARAYWLLPIWLLMEIFSGALFGSSSGVAHSAHVGGFVFGAVAAVRFRYFGLEHGANPANEAKG